MSAGMSAGKNAGTSAVTLNARRTDGFDARLADTLGQLQSAAKMHPGAIVQATSLGAEDMVITDLIARHALPITVATLDTGFLHAETLGLIPKIDAHYGIQVTRFQPQAEQVLHFLQHNGERAMFNSIALRKACCDVRKMEPLARLLKGNTAWVTGLRREQSNNRAEVSMQEIDGNGRSKINALAAWSWHDVWHYIATHKVPYNPLHDQFYPSIGCAPCTRAIAQGEDFRAGRWWWEEETSKECGLHVAHSTPQIEEARA